MKINLYDAQNYFRVKLEADGTGMTVRGLYSEIAASTEINVMVWDGAGGSKKRKEIYPEYKNKRKPASESIWENLKFCREVLGYTKCLTVCVPGYEADDVIAHLAIRLSGKGIPIHIWSTDTDLMQLCRIPNVTHMKGDFKGGIPFEYVRLYKTTVGDASDNIKGIPGFGEKAFDACNKDALLRYVSRQSDDIAATGIKDGSVIANWMVTDRATLDAMWEITGFFVLDSKLVDEHSTHGVPNPEAALARFREFLM